MSVLQHGRRYLGEMARELRARGATTSRRYVWALAAAATSLALSLLTNLLASRALGPGGFGEFAVGVATLTLLATAMGAGMPVTMVRFWGRLSDATVQTRERSRVHAWGLALISTALIGVAFLVFETAMPGALARWVPSGTGPALVLGGAGAALSQMGVAETQMRLNLRGYFVTTATAGCLRLVGLAIAVFGMGGGAPSAALLGFALGSFVAGTAMTGSALRRTGRWLRGPIAALRFSTGTLVVFGLPILGSAFVVAAIEQVDILMLATAVPSDRLGVYSAGARLLVIQGTTIAALTTLALPLASRAAATGAHRDFARSVLAFGLPLGLLVTGVLVLSSPILVALVYGPAYVESAMVFAILSAGLLPNFVGNPASQILYAAGAPGLLLWVHVGQLGALVLGLPTVAGRWGLVGVAAYRSTVNLAAVVLILAQVVRITRRARRLAVLPG